MRENTTKKKSLVFTLFLLTNQTLLHFSECQLIDIRNSLVRKHGKLKTENSPQEVSEESSILLFSGSVDCF